MGEFIGRTLDHVVLILICGAAIYIYAKSAEKRAKHRWMIPVMAAAVLYHCISLVVALSQGMPLNGGKLAAETPPQAQLMLMLEKAKVVPFDSRVNLKNGPKFTVPAGYKYIEPTKGAIELCGVGPTGENLMLTFLVGLPDLNKAKDDLVKNAIEKSPHFKVISSRAEKIHGYDAIVIKFINPQFRTSGYHVIVKCGANGYLLVMFGDESYASVNEPIFQMMIKSFHAGR